MNAIIWVRGIWISLPVLIRIPLIKQKINVFVFPKSVIKAQTGLQVYIAFKILNNRPEGNLSRKPIKGMAVCQSEACGFTKVSTNGVFMIVWVNIFLFFFLSQGIHIENQEASQ